MFYLLFFFLSLKLLPIPVYAQNDRQKSAELDSLRRVIFTTRQDTIRVSTMNEVSRYFWSELSRYDSSLVYSRAAYSISERIGFQRGIAMALTNIAIVYSQQGNYGTAIEHYMKALRIYEELGDKETIATSLNNIGNVFWNQGKFGEALEYHFKTLRIREELGNKKGIAISLNNIGLVHWNQGKYSEALEYYFKSLKIYEELGNKVSIASLLNNIGITYWSMGKYTEALVNYFKSLQIRQELGNKGGVARSLNNIGETYYKQGKYNEAREYYFKSLRIKEELGDKSGTIRSFNEIGKVYCSEGKYDSALFYSFRSLHLADSIGAKPQKKEALEALAAAYDSLGQHKRALEYHRQFVALKDSLVNAESLEKTAKLREGYEAEKREQQIVLLNKDKDLLTKEKALQESELERRSIDLARSRAEQELQHKSILLLSNEKDLRELTVSRQEAELSAAHARDEQNKQALALAQSERDLQRAELQRRNVIQWSLAGFLVLVAISTVWLWWLNRQKLRANKKILKQQQVLEEQAIEIEAANKELQSTNIELDEANRMKTQLLSMAAHDLKNPLGVIIGYSDIILFDTPEDSDTGKYVHDIQSAAYRMNKLISDLLDSAAMEMGNITLELDEVLLPVLVSTIAARYEYNAAQKGQQILMETVDDIAILADVARLEQVFDNLVSNAVKYSPHGKTIRLRAKKINTIARFEVQDEGPGMSEEDKQKLFGFFQRLSAEPTGGESSNGVGLAIVKKIVDLHKGRIWAESELGKGTTFIVELPISRQILS